MNQNKYTAFIPVRAGSKSIKFKNIRPIAGKPLVCWSIEAACGCGVIGEVYISTDGEEIRRCVEEHMAEFSHPEKIRFVERDPATASDTASTESAMIDFAGKADFRNLILIQATSPLLTSADLAEAVTIYERDGYDSVLSAVRQKRFVWVLDAKGSGTAANYDYHHRPRRQEFEGFLVENGAFYITSAQAFCESGCRLSGRIGIYEMPEDTYYEIDEPTDWVIVENLLKRRKNVETSISKREPVKLVITDCDGVLTDGGMYYTETGDECKKFHTKDGMGLQRLREAGVRCGIITGEDTQIVANRARKLQLDYLYKGVKDKLPVLQEVAKKEGIPLSQVAYIGDDCNDLECIQAAGIGIAVADAADMIKDAADHVLKTKGGCGAVREAAEFILQHNQREFDENSFRY